MWSFASVVLNGIIYSSEGEGVKMSMLDRIADYAFILIDVNGKNDAVAQGFRTYTSLLIPI